MGQRSSLAEGRETQMPEIEGKVQRVLLTTTKQALTLPSYGEIKALCSVFKILPSEAMHSPSSFFPSSPHQRLIYIIS